MKKENIERTLIIGLAGLSVYGADRNNQFNDTNKNAPTTAHTVVLNKDPLDDYPPYFSKQTSTPSQPTIESSVEEKKPMDSQSNNQPIATEIEVFTTYQPSTVHIEYDNEESINKAKMESVESEAPLYNSVNWKSLNLIDEINVQKWEDLILKHANIKGVPPEIIAVTIDTESHGRTDEGWDELPGDGAGLMGIMPNDENNSFPNRPDRETLINNHDLNIGIGTAILAEINTNTNQGDGNWFKTFLWYNAGLKDRLKYAIPYAKHVYSKLGWEISEDNVARLMEIENGVYDLPTQSD